jgi:hypothetical protein
MRERIEAFCYDVMGMTAENTTTDIMRKVMVEAIEKWEDYKAQQEWEDIYGRS